MGIARAVWYGRAVLALLAQTNLPLHDAMDLACGGVSRADTLSMWGCALACGGVLFASWHRRRAVLEDEHGTWAAIMALVHVAQVLTAMWLVPMGCLSSHLLSTFVGWASPWLVAAVLFRSAVRPTPEALRGGDPNP